jgi:hypothetical protein
MIVINLAEWVINLFILSIAALIWVLVILGTMMIISIMYETIKGVLHDKHNGKSNGIS